ncbi:ATP-binding protein [Micromonospora avicenniae]|uniref:ATP-binding protein n=1 Tax=Micromonospora avicenniae TaxID=1198245 RepID=UPI003433F086
MLFGGVRVWRGDTELDVGPPQQRALLTLLLAAGGDPLGLDAIVDALWSHDPSGSAVNSVHRYVGALRRLFEPSLPNRAPGRWLLRSGKGYRLVADADCADLPAFRAHIAAAEGDPSAEAVTFYARALDLARGPVGSGVDLLRDHSCLRAVERERVDAAITAAHAAVHWRSPEKVLPAVQDLSADEPLNEPLQAAVMALLTATGRHAEAISLYGVIRERLAEELGIDPSPVLQDAYRQVLDADHAAATEPAAAHKTRPAQLPMASPVFAGRDGEITAVLDRLGSDGGDAPVVISAIGGMAGIGKTALAVHCAHALADQFPDGQLYLNLRGFDPDGRVVSAEDALRGFLEALGTNPASLPDQLDDRAALFRSQLAGRRVLVVLDNARDTEQVRPLLPGAPGCRVIVTSRNQLTGLVTHDGAQPLRLSPLSDADARRLLVRRLGHTRVAEDPAATDRIIAACAGLPLALAIVSARAAANSFSLSVLADELAMSADRLDALTVDEPIADVRAVFSWSYRMLPVTAADVFRRLAVHPGPEISLAAAASITGLPSARVRGTVAALIAGNLLTEVSPGRYVMHDLIREYAAELLDTAERDAAFGRLVDHYVHSTRSAYLTYGRPPVGDLSPEASGVIPETPADNVEAMTWYTRERAVLRAVVDAAIAAGLDRPIAHIVLDWRPMVFQTETLNESLPYALAGLSAAQRSDDLRLQAEAERDVANKYNIASEDDLCVKHFARALELFQQLGDSLGESNTSRNLAMHHMLRGRCTHAAEYAQRSVEAARRAGDRATLSVALGTVADVSLQTGRYDQTVDLASEALMIARQDGIAYLQSPLLETLGRAHSALGSHSKAIAAFDEGLRLARENQDWVTEVDHLGYYGDALYAAGEHAAARATWTEFFDKVDAMGAREAMSGWAYSDGEHAALETVRRARLQEAA